MSEATTQGDKPLDPRKDSAAEQPHNQWVRETALEQAVASSMPSAQTDEILARAAAFEAFLNGTPLPQPPSAKGVQAGILAEDGSFQQL